MSEKMTKDQKDYIAMLKERDKPMPMGKYFWQTERFKDDPPVNICGNCGEYVADNYVFCPKCGQRVDHENYKL